MTTLAFFLDPVYIVFVMLPSLVLALWAQARVKSAYAKASKVPSLSGMTGAQVAQEIMHADGITDVRVEQVQGFLSDHYDPRKKVLRLSPDVYAGRSLAALGIAAHEAGHALQDAKAYAPLAIRNGIVPIASIGSGLSFFVIIAGLLLQMYPLAWVGVLLFASVVLFQLVNLPVEFDASKRARERLLALSMVTPGEDGTVAKVLNAAALTYVAAMVGAILNLAYYAMLVAGASRE